jgi:hypothetical protein
MTPGTTSSPGWSRAGSGRRCWSSPTALRGLIGAAEQLFPHSLRQRCLVRRATNLLAKVPQHAQAEIKQAFWQIFEDIDAPAGHPWSSPAAVPCITDTLAELTVHLRFPREHGRGIRHSNFIERTFGETRRGIKVIGRLPGETSCLLLVWAVLDPASGGFRGVTQRPAGVRLLQDLRRQLLAGDGPVSSQGRWSTACHHRRLASVSGVRARAFHQRQDATAAGDPCLQVLPRRSAMMSAKAVT